MKQFNGFEEAKKEAQASGGAKLPAGAYVCKVLGVKYENGKNGGSDQIILQFDIAEGEYKDFFQKHFAANTSDNKKYKGVTRIWVPTDDGSENDAITKKSFAGWTNSFEESNTGYSWDWDETKWKGKIIGIVFGETGTRIENRDVIYTEARFAISADRVRKGDAPAAKFKSKNGYGSSCAPSTNGGFMNIPDGVVEELPFT